MENRARLSLADFLGDISGVILRPSHRFMLIHERGVLWGSLFLLLAPAYLGMHFLGGIYFDRDPFPGYSWLIPVLGAAVITYIKAAFIHILARLFEGRGRYAAASGRFRDLLVVFGYAGIPSILALLLATFSFLLLASQIGYLMRNLRPVGVSLLVAIGITFFIWNLVLMVLGLRRVYPMRDWKIVISVLIGPLLASGAGMGLMQVAGSAKVDAEFVSPIVNENFLEVLAAEGSREEGRSPGIMVHTDLLVYRFKAPRRSDLVIFFPPPEIGNGGKGQGSTIAGETGSGRGGKRKMRVGRIVGLPGERVELRAGRLNIDERPWNEPYLFGANRVASSAGPLALGVSEYLVLPEDRRLAAGGFEGWIVPRQNIQGRIILNRWPIGWWFHRETALRSAHPEP